MDMNNADMAMLLWFWTVYSLEQVPNSACPINVNETD